ncbi:MAG: thioredoxin domain-containing protein [archaeon]
MEEERRETTDIPQKDSKPVEASHKPTNQFKLVKVDQGHKPAQQGRKSMGDVAKNNPWIISTFVLGIAVLILLVGNFNPTGGVVGVKVGADDAGQAVLGLAQAQVPDSEVVEVTEESGLYKVLLSMDGNEVPVYVTLDGVNLVSGLTPLSILQERATAAPSQNPTPTEVPKSDKPTVELFVMTHCPYGAQAEKGFIPAITALGDSVDATVRFVHYYMHTNQQEEVETPREVCIREEQGDKFNDYLECFLGKTGTPADAAACEKEVGINSAKLQTCIDSGKADEYYAADSTLSNQYGVQGSPTLIINGVKSNAGRDSASYLVGICSAFNDAPEACTSELSSAAPSPGFGYNEGGPGNSAAQCG